MSQHDTPNAEDRIFAAVIEIGATQGIGATSMAAVAKLAKVSAGTLYLHFLSKEDMLQRVYLRLKRMFHNDLMQGAAAQPPAEAVAAMWQALIQFQARMPFAILFLETAGAAQVLSPDQKRSVAAFQEEVNAVVSAAIAAGAIRVASLDVAITILVGSALHLARKYAAQGVAVPEAEARQTFAAVWAGLGGT